MTGYKHRECGKCGTEIGFSEEFLDCGEYVLCQECESEMTKAHKSEETANERKTKRR